MQLISSVEPRWHHRFNTGSRLFIWHAKQLQHAMGVVMLLELFNTSSVSRRLLFINYLYIKSKPRELAYYKQVSITFVLPWALSCYLSLPLEIPVPVPGLAAIYSEPQIDTSFSLVIDVPRTQFYRTPLTKHLFEHCFIRYNVTFRWDSFCSETYLKY